MNIFCKYIATTSSNIYNRKTVITFMKGKQLIPGICKYCSVSTTIEISTINNLEETNHTENYNYYQPP